MNKVLPFIFPVVALVIVGFLAFRWYRLQTSTAPTNDQIGEGLQIEDLSPAEQERILRGTGDFKTVRLVPQENVEGQGTVRYEVVGEQLNLTVQADLPQLTSGVYQVWLDTATSDQPQRGFNLTMSKNGFSGSAALPSSVLPLDIIITRENADDATPETALFRAAIER